MDLVKIITIRRGAHDSISPNELFIILVGNF